MATIHETENYCLFNTADGVVDAGGCTKQYLDDNDGDPSALFAPDGSPVLQLASTPWYNSTGRIEIPQPADIAVGMVVYMASVTAGVNAGHYTITAIDGNSIELGDIGSDSWADGLVEICVGGSYSDIQDAIDEGDAELNDCWIFTTEDISGKDYSVTSGDGDYINNTSKYIVGYKTNCYDALPAGHGYFPDAIGDGQHFKTTEQWMQGDHSEAALQAALCQLDCSGQANLSSFFKISTTTEKIEMMGFYSPVDIGYWHYLVEFDDSVGDHESSVKVKHCVIRNKSYEAQTGVGDTAKHGAIFRLEGGVGKVEVSECVCLSSLPMHVASGANGDAVVWGCTMDRCSSGLTAADLKLTIHHNIVTHSNWGSNILQNSNTKAYNNTFYKVFKAAFFLGASGTEHVFLDVYNNIYVMEPAAASYIAFINESGGGSFSEDYNCYVNTDGSPVTWVSTPPVNTDWNIPAKGQNSIEVDPLFVDAANYDFRPLNPNVITGGKPASGVATYMGAVAPKYYFKTNSRAANVGGLSIIRN